MSIPVVYRDRDVLCIIKPADISSESDDLCQAISLQEHIEKPYLINRLDLNVGGLLLFALNKEAAASLNRMLGEHLIEKEYYAVVSSFTADENGVFSDLLYHDKQHNKTFVVKTERKGVRKAELRYQCIDRCRISENEYSLICVKPLTGRTHQIRVQFASRGFPLIGDKKYGSRIDSRGPALYAFRIAFIHPVSHKRIDISVSIPDRPFPWNVFHRQ